MNPFFLPFFDAPMLDWGNLKKNRRKTNNIHTPRLIGVLPIELSCKLKDHFISVKNYLNSSYLLFRIIAHNSLIPVMKPPILLPQRQ
jgi:hypothetical protein